MNLSGKLLLVFPLWLIWQLTFGQEIQNQYTVIQYPAVLEKFTELPKELKESSALLLADGKIWTLNDSGGKAEMYGLTAGDSKVETTIQLENAENHDWEALAMDNTHFYIGDFGNNLGTRKDLKVYKVEIPKEFDKKKIKVDAQLISFAYADQQSFELLNRANNFDCESLIKIEDDLILFSKNWENGMTRMYRLSAVPGTYNIAPVDYLDVGGLITGADYQKEIKTLVLVGYEKYVPFLFVFEGFNGKDLKVERIFRINLPRMKNSQTEGICFLSENEVLISTEQTKEYDQQVFKLDISKVLIQAGY